MEIIKFASKTCVKCKVLNRTLAAINLPVQVKTLYLEDNKDLFEQNKIETMPTLIFKNGDKEVRLSNMISISQINEALKQVE